MKIEIFDINNESIEDLTINYKDLIDFQKKLSHDLKSAQFHLLKLLKLKYQKLENKMKKKDGNNVELKLKHKREEMEFLKAADLDNMAKRIFANKYSEEDLDKLGDKMSMEDRVIIRCSNFKLIKDKISQFRSEHHDWEKLAEDLLYKNSSGRVKIVKSKKVGSLPLANGVNINEVKIISNLKESILLVPVLEAEKKDKVTKKRIAAKELQRKIELEKLEEEKIKENRGLQISEEEIKEYINNVDDLNDWEKEINDDEEEEIDLITQLDGSGTMKRRRKNRTEKKMNITGQNRKEATNQKRSKKAKESY